MKRLAFILIIGLCSSAYGETVFIGHPIQKITISEHGVIEKGMSGSDADEFRVVIEKIDGSYFWKSRENLELVPQVSGIYTTYVAENGSGYIRVITEWMRQTGDTLPKEERGYYYMEHLIHTMGSITYMGR